MVRAVTRRLLIYRRDSAHADSDTSFSLSLGIWFGCRFWDIWGVRWEFMGCPTFSFRKHSNGNNRTRNQKEPLKMMEPLMCNPAQPHRQSQLPLGVTNLFKSSFIVLQYVGNQHTMCRTSLATIETLRATRRLSCFRGISWRSGLRLSLPEVSIFTIGWDEAQGLGMTLWKSTAEVRGLGFGLQDRDQ